MDGSSAPCSSGASLRMLPFPIWAFRYAFDLSGSISLLSSLTFAAVKSVAVYVVADGTPPSAAPIFQTGVSIAGAANGVPPGLVLSASSEVTAAMETDENVKPEG